LDNNSNRRVSPHWRHNLLSHHTDRRVLPTEMGADISDNGFPMAADIPWRRTCGYCEIISKLFLYAIKVKKIHRNGYISIPMY